MALMKPSTQMKAPGAPLRAKHRTQPTDSEEAEVLVAARPPDTSTSSKCKLLLQ